MKISGLFSKKYTFIFVPDVTGKFMRFSIPKAAVKLLLILSLAAGGGFGYFSYTVFKKSEDLRELADLRQATAGQKLEIQQFSQKMKQVETQLARLEKFDRKLRVITNLEGSAPSTSEFGLGGPAQDSYADFSSISKKYTQALLNTLNKDAGRLKDQAEVQEASFFELDEFFKEQSSLLSHTPSIWPVRGWITSTFGYRKSPFTGLREIHEGLDIATQLRTPVMSPASGIVTNVGIANGYGNLVEIDHGYGVVTKYGHLAKALVTVGQKIKRGDTVALVGNTGRTTGTHLHYEVVLNGIPVNPYRYILED